MVDQVINNTGIAFEGMARRQGTSFVREYAVVVTYIANGDSLSDEIDIRNAAGVAVSIDSNMTGTHLAVYASAEQGGIKRPVYDDSDNLLIQTATDGAIIVLSPYVFPLGFISLVSCSDADGTLETEGGRRQFLVMLKP